VALQKKIGRRKVKNMAVWLRKIVLAVHFCTGCRATPAVDWLDSLIGPSGLLLL
jgi:hypothetical protein